MQWVLSTPLPVPVRCMKSNTVYLSEQFSRQYHIKPGYLFTLDEIQFTHYILLFKKLYTINLMASRIDKGLTLRAFVLFSSPCIGSTMLVDDSLYDNHGLIVGGASFVPSTLDAGRFEVTYPDARKKKRRKRSVVVHSELWLKEDYLLVKLYTVFLCTFS